MSLPFTINTCMSIPAIFVAMRRLPGLTAATEEVICTSTGMPATVIVIVDASS